MDISSATPLTGSLVPDVLQVIKESSEFPLFCNKYLDLVKKLSPADDTTLEIYLPMLEKFVAKSTPLQIIEHILVQWVRVENATIENLIHILDQMGFYDIKSGICEKILTPHNAQHQTKLADTFQHEVMDSINERAGQTFKQKPHITKYKFVPQETDVEEYDKHFNRGKSSKLDKLWTSVHLGMSLTLNLVLMGMFASWYYNSLTNQHDFPNNINPDTRDKPMPPKHGLFTGHTEESLEIIAHSYNDYQRKVYQLSPFININVTVVLLQKDPWPNGVPLVGANQIKKLTIKGYFDMDTVISILSEAMFVEHLQFESTLDKKSDKSGQLPQDSYSQLLEASSRKNVVLKKLHTISFKDVSDFTQVFDFLATTVGMPAIKTFQMTTGAINDQNIVSLERFLVQSRNTLQTLDFQGVNWKSALFKSESITFPNIVEIKADSDIETIVNTQLVGENFCQVFPNLESFIADKYRISWGMLSAILECPNLIQIKIGAAVPAHESTVKLSSLRNASPSLKEVKLLLFFPNKKLSDKCFIDGISYARKQFHFFIGANCQIVEV